jgi:excisionase family DNA binding protein
MSDQLLKVDEVADRMRVNRRTAQSWIDSGELPAIDVRPDGAQRALWRVQPRDLLEFAQRRKLGQSMVMPAVGEDLLD